jgi:hypothetical protein
MTQLLPAAQAVLDAINKELDEAPWDVSFLAGVSAAAAIRAAADQVVPEESLYGGNQRWEWERDARQSSRKKLLAIADELKEL